MRPRRVRCRGCGATQVLPPAALQPRRADSTEVIGTALARKAEGLGYRRIAAALVDAARMLGYLSLHEMRRVHAALRIVLGL